MKNRRLALYIVIFIICLVCGLIVGLSVNQRDIDEGSPLADLLFRNPTPANGQQNYLVIGVDRIDSNLPELTSIWMILYHPDFPKVSLIPIFPQVTTLPPELNLDISSKFALNDQGLPVEALFEELTTKNYWWSGYVLMDQLAMIAIVDSIGGLDMGNGIISGALAIGNLTAVRNDPDLVIDDQANLLNNMCSRILTNHTNIDFDELLSLFPRHIRSDRTPLELKTVWEEIITVDRVFACTFPTILMTTP